MRGKPKTKIVYLMGIVLPALSLLACAAARADEPAPAKADSDFSRDTASYQPLVLAPRNFSITTETASTTAGAAPENVDIIASSHRTLVIRGPENLDIAVQAARFFNPAEPEKLRLQPLDPDGMEYSTVGGPLQGSSEAPFDVVAMNLSSMDEMIGVDGGLKVLFKNIVAPRKASQDPAAVTTEQQLNAIPVLQSLSTAPVMSSSMSSTPVISNQGHVRDMQVLGGSSNILLH